MTPAEMVKLIERYEAAMQSKSEMHLVVARFDLDEALPAIREALAAWAWLETDGTAVMETTERTWTCFVDYPSPDVFGPTPLAAVVAAMGEEQPQ